MTRKFLDRPTRYLRDSADRGESERVASLLLKMFDLKPLDTETPREDGRRRPKSGPQRLLKGGRDDV